MSFFDVSRECGRFSSLWRPSATPYCWLLRPLAPARSSRPLQHPGRSPPLSPAHVKAGGGPWSAGWPGPLLCLSFIISPPVVFPLCDSRLHLPVCRPCPHPDAPTTTPTPTTATTAAVATIPSTVSSLDAHPGTVPAHQRRPCCLFLRERVFVSQAQRETSEQRSKVT